MARDLICSVTLLGIAAGYYVLASGIGRSALSDEVGPGGLPILYATLLAAFAILLGVTTLVRAILGRRSRPGGRSYSDSAEPTDVGATASSRILDDASRPGGRSYSDSAEPTDVGATASSRTLDDASRPGGRSYSDGAEPTGVGATASSRILDDASRPGGRSYSDSAEPTGVGATASSRILDDASRPGGRSYSDGAEPTGVGATASSRILDDASRPGGRSYLRSGGVLAIGIGYLLIVPFAGYFLSLLLVITATAIYFGERPSARLALIALGGASFFWIFFVALLGIPMPTFWGG